MSKFRFTLSLFVVLAFIGPVPGQQRPPDFDASLRAAEQRIQQNRPPEAVKMCDDMLAQFKEPGQVKEIRLLKAQALERTKKHPEALAELAKVQTDFAEDKDALARALLLTAEVFRGQQQFADAVAAYQKVAKDFPDQADRAASALLAAGDVLNNDLKQYPQAVEAYQAVEAKFPARTALCAQAAGRLAGVCETQTKDFLAAAGAYERLADKYASQFDDKTTANHFAKGVEMLRKAEKHAEALAMAKKGEKAVETSANKVPLLTVQPAILLDMKKTAEARAEADRIICQYPLELDLCQAVQAQVVESYRLENKFAEALGAARSLYDAAGTDANIRSAAQAIGLAFRSVDANLGRANEFLAYQRFGPDGPDGKPNTEDDVKVNHLVAVKYPPGNPERDKQYTQAVAAQPETYDGFRAKAYLCVYWGRTKEAVGFFRTAFKACPDPLVPQAANELILVGMKAYRASFAGLDQVYEYVSYGPKGKSGKENIPDPFAGL